MATAKVTFSDGRTATIEGKSRAEIEAAVLEVERSIAAAPKPDERGNIADSIAKGATLGFSDEIAGALGAIPAAFQTGSSIPDAYRGIRDAARGNEQAFAERNPGTALAAEIGGGVLTGGLGAGRAAAVNVAKSVPKLAGVGAGVGATAGLGNSEGETIGAMATDTAIGGAVGGVAGVLLPPVAKAIGKGVTAPMRYAQATRAARPVKKLGQAIARDDMTPEKVAAELRKLPKGAAIADAGGENLQTLGRDVTVQPGRARNIARALFDGRRKEAPKRIDDAVRSALKQEGDFYPAKKALADEMKTAAAPFYDEAYKAPVSLNPKLKAILKRPVMQDALRQGQKLAKNEGDVIGGNMQLLDYAKRALDDQRSVAIRTGNNQLARAITKTKQELVGELDAQVPAYGKARAAFAGPKALDDALDTGRKFMSEDAEIIAEMIQDMTASEKQFFRMGAIRDIRDKVLSKSDTADAYKAIFNSPLKREKIQALFPNAREFAKFQRAMQGEARMFETGTKAMANSSTANKLAGVEDLATDPGILIDAATGSPTMAALNALKTWMRRNAPVIKNEKMRDELASMLFSADPATQQKILKQIGAPVSVRSINDIPLKIQGAVVGAETAASLSN